MRVPGPAGNLAGTLTLPGRGRAPFPAVVTLTGSGAHHRDGNRTPEHPYRPFRDIANALAGCGIATLRLDDRGVGASAGDADGATADDTAADAHAALRFLRARTDIDPRRVGLIGHSYGGEIAPMVAAVDPAVAALVLMAGPARPFRETMRYQHRYRIRNDPTIAAADREAALAGAMRQQALNVAASPEAWRRSIQDRDPLPTARRLRMPVLILHGLTDRAVDPEDALLLERAIRARTATGRSNAGSSPASTTTSSAIRSARAKATTGCPPRRWRPRSWPRCAPGLAPRCDSMAIVHPPGRSRPSGRIFLTVVAGIAAGGAAGAGVGAGLYPPSAGVALAIIAGALTGAGVWRARRLARG